MVNVATQGVNMKTLTDLLLVLSILSILGGCLSGTAQAGSYAEYERIGEYASEKIKACFRGANRKLGRYEAFSFCIELVANDLAIKDSSGLGRGTIRDGEIE